MANIVNKAVIDAINVNYRREFTLAMERQGGTPLMDRLTWQTTSSKKSENYAWMLEMVRMREWLGQREDASAAEVFSHVIKNRKYEASLYTAIEDIEDGTYVLRSKSEIAQLVEAYTDYREEKIHDLLDSGFTQLGPDGQLFFDTDHPVGRMTKIRANGAETYQFDQTGVYSNKTTDLFDEQALWDARKNFRLLTNHLGVPSGAVPNTLIVGPELEQEALTLTSTGHVIDATDTVLRPNILQGKYELIVDPRITDSKWFLASTDRVLKPFIFQNRVAPQLQHVGSANPSGEVDDAVFMSDSIKHGLRTRFGVGYGVPHLIYGSDASGS